MYIDSKIINIAEESKHTLKSYRGKEETDLSNQSLS